LRFKTDENLHPEVAEILKQHGHDAVSVWDEDLRGASDLEVAEACRHERRVLLTLDIGFGDIRRYEPSSFPGIIVMRLAHQSRRAVAAVLDQLMVLLEAQVVSGALWIVDEQRVRIRRGAGEE